MIGLKLLGFGKVASTLILLYLISIGVSLTIGTSYDVLTGLEAFIQGFELGKPLIMEKSAKSIYTSIIPTRLANDLETVLGLNAKPVVTALGYADGVLAPIWDQSVLTHPLDMINATGIILGKHLADKLGKRQGDDILLTSVLRNSVYIVKVVEVKEFNDPRDNYVFAPSKLARALRGIQDTEASIIMFESQRDAEQALKYLSQLYELRLNYDVGVEVKLRIIASDGSLASEKKISGKGVEVFRIPLGYYQLIVSTGYAEIIVDSVKLKDSIELSLNLQGTVTLKILDCPEEPKLMDADGKILRPERVNNVWSYRIPVGVYFLNVGGHEIRIPVVSDQELRLGKGLEKEKNLESYRVVFQVRYIDGKQVEDAYLTIASSDGRLITSTTITGFYESYLQNGLYNVTLSKSGYVLKKKLIVDGEKSVDFILPLRSDGKMMYTRSFEAKILPTGYDSMSMISIMVLSAELGILITVSILAVLVYLSIISHLFESCSSEFEKLRELRFSIGFIFKSIYLPLSILFLLAGTLGGLSSIYFVEMIYWPQILPSRPVGLNPLLYFVHTVLLVSSLTHSYLKLYYRKWF